MLQRLSILEHRVLWLRLEELVQGVLLDLIKVRLGGEVNLLYQLLLLFPALIIQRPLLDEYGHASKLNNIALADYLAPLRNLPLLQILAKTAHPAIFIHVANSVVGDDEAAFL